MLSMTYICSIWIFLKLNFGWIRHSKHKVIKLIKCLFYSIIKKKLNSYHSYEVVTLVLRTFDKRFSSIDSHVNNASLHTTDS